MMRARQGKVGAFRLRAKIIPFLVILSMLLGVAITFSVSIPAKADTSNYPYPSIACVWSPYATTGTGNWCKKVDTSGKIISEYDWGTIRDDNSNSSELSPYGYDYRNCTDFVAWKVASLGVSSAQYKGLGHAKDWAANAPANKLTVNTTPAIGAVAVDTGGSFGHVAFISAYNSSTGIISIQEYNRGEDGNYGTNSGTLSGLGFSKVIHFEKYETSGSSGWPGVGSATFLNADHLNDGQVMTSSQYIVSGNVQHALIMQSDGNLVEYSGTTATWASNTGNHPGAYLGLQSDGNIVIYSSSGSPLWATNTGGQSLSYLDMQDDGNLVAYSTSGSPIWASNTNNFSVFTFVGADHLNDGATLTSGNYIRSADKRYALLMQPDGNLVLYGPGYHVLWATGTSGHSGAYLGLQGDGNMVVYSSSGQALWASNTSGKSLSYLVLQTDGNLVAVNTSGSPIWATGTNGKI